MRLFKRCGCSARTSKMPTKRARELDTCMGKGCRNICCKKPDTFWDEVLQYVQSNSEYNRDMQSNVLREAEST